MMHAKSGLLRSIKSTFLALFGAAIVAAIAVAVVWPLWYLATSFTALYSALALAGIVAVMAIVAIGRMRAIKAEKETVIARPLAPFGAPIGLEPDSGASEDVV